MFSTITAQPGRQMRNKTWGAGPSLDPILITGLATSFVTGFATGLATGFATRRGADFRARVVRRVVRLAVRRDVLVAVIKCSQLPAAPGSFFKTPANSKTLQV